MYKMLSYVIKKNQYIEQKILDYSLSQSDKGNKQQNTNNNSYQFPSKNLNIIEKIRI